MTITTEELKKEIDLIDNAIKEDILVTKKGKPFAVIMDAKRYSELIDNELSEEEKIEPRAGWDEKFRDMDETQYLQSSKKNKDRLDSTIKE